MWLPPALLLLSLPGSEQEVKTDRMSIRDNQSNHSLTVTMTQLRRDDTDIYWCGIERLGPDLGVQINVTVDPEATTPASLLTASNQTGVSSGSYIRTRYMLLVFVKVPVLLILVGAVLWLKGLKYNRDWPSTRTCPLTF
ncbi:CMRF35-like molecule 7 isoform X2 [Equus przewalskii]|uniref:CMRF35-like molecule 7 isoform X2 n=1 Tax=Equus przewalskii TaxID=9798 RepID=A0ABM2ERA9_EQUPR|nr:CMRF35-like molecule 7 isoform X3 [Equus caballus]XP_008511403.1 PREDICTED: CMRF35-like molecule 7 isoform X3 [Equus przewalskii]